MLLEIAQVPPDYVDEFKSVSKFRQAFLNMFKFLFLHAIEILKDIQYE
jgi:hypothetical protein